MKEILLSPFFENKVLSRNKEKGDLELNCNKFRESMPEEYEFFIKNAEEFLITLKKLLKLLGKSPPKDILNFKIINFKNEIKIHQIRQENLNKLYEVRGNIKRITKVIPRTTEITYECPSCGATIKQSQDKKKKTIPTLCSCGNKRSFSKLSEITSDIQELNLEEVADEIGDKQPQQIRVYLEGELTEPDFSNKLKPGKKIEVVGIIKKLPIFMTQKDEDENITEFMVYANNITSLEEEEDLVITEEDERQIIEIAADNPLQRLAKNLAPEVYGNEIVKEAIILQLVKGISKKKSDGTLTRNDIHILLSGDPGVAKSVTVKATVVRTPNARMVIGTKTSRVGLGAMAVKDELLNNWSLEVGSLVLSSGSLLVIDELDKMYKENLSELLEPMSSSTVTISKAGIFAKLPARTSILASANPIQGTYDLSQPLAKQIDLPSPILNRFDLIFIMIDSPNAEFDAKSIEHVFNTNIKPIELDIPIVLFKKYVHYCRKLEPKIKPELLQNLKDFYVTLRQRSNKDKEKGLPINLRNMEGLMRLSAASAKIRLSEFVEKKDLNIAKKIFMFCLKQVGIDNETGIIDTSRETMKVPISKRGKLTKLLVILNNLEKRLGKVPYEEVIKEATSQNIKSWEIDDFIDELKSQNKIFEPQSNYYKIIK